MLNNIEESSRLFTEFTAWLESAENGLHSGLEDEAVDTREPIENFFEGKDVTVDIDETVDGIRRVRAFVKTPGYKGIKELIMMSDGEWTLVLTA
jgi:succinate dehydrogenase/fumarate reductase-like Fe-S protein